ncbi:MAG TPA: PAS domain S-box protein [Polyangia bacterium]|nr:PAS domain S-box protein [Polyangia bacterium]
MNSTTGGADDRALANALPQIIWTCDAQGRLEWVNDRWIELTGLTQEQSLRDKGALAAVHPDDHADIGRRFGEAIASGSTCEFEYRIRNRAGEYRFHLCRVVPVRDAAGAVTRWVAAAFDIHERRQAEEALRQSEKRFQTVFHLNPLPAAITRLSDGLFLDVNDAFLRMSCFDRADVVGKTGIEIGMLSPEQRAGIKDTVARTGSIAFDLQIPTKHGERRTVTVVSSLVEIAGEPCLVNVGEDVSDQRAAEIALRESEARARARADELAGLMDAVPAAVWIARDPECREIHGNRAGRALLRIPDGANMSKTALDPTPTRHFTTFAGGVEVPPSELPLQRAARGVEVRDYADEIRFDDGRVIHLYGTAVPLRDPSGAPRGAIGAFVDVTRLKQAEEALLEADRRKDEFLALLSHELRNPLAPILSAAQLMQFRGDVAAPEEREVIVRQAQHLVRLVDDLLDVSRVARGKVTLIKKPIELGAVVGKAVEGAIVEIKQRRHQLHLAVPAGGLAVEADEVRLTQVVANLLTNAARYTEPGGRIEVTAAREGDEIVLRVRDNGRGIDPALLPHVFEMFVQGPRGSDRTEGGLGLGLSLVQTLTQLHGGRVSAESDGVGRGSEFTVRLPASRSPSQPVSPPRLAPSRLGGVRGHRVLVVDDNRDGAQMISGLLREAGYEVRTALDGSQALSVASDFRPRVAILDVGLPVMDGYTLGRELRARMGTAAPILIALTGYGQEQDQRRSAEAGFTLHLVKPVDGLRLNHLVDALVGAA